MSIKNAAKSAARGLFGKGEPLPDDLRQKRDAIGHRLAVAESELAENKKRCAELALPAEEGDADASTQLAELNRAGTELLLRRDRLANALAASDQGIAAAEARDRAETRAAQLRKLEDLKTRRLVLANGVQGK